MAGIGLDEAVSGDLTSGTGRLWLGDAFEVAKAWPRAMFRLIYLDPPFFSGRERVGSVPAGAKRHGQAGGDGEQARTGSPAPDKPPAYDDRWPDGFDAYLDWLEARLRAVKPLLQKNGSLIVHLDHRAVHDIKVRLDRLFGRERFINEIIWHYTGGGRSRSRFSCKHDTLLWYANGPTPYFDHDAVRVPYKPTSGYARGGITSRAGKKYQPHPGGTPVDDVWDIPIINPLSAERTGYPTQKPLVLLERLISGLTGQDDLVGDLFCGSGTSLVAAAKLGRRWLGADRSADALAVTASRLEAVTGSRPPVVTGDSFER